MGDNRKKTADLRAAQEGRAFMAPRAAARALLPIDPRAGVRWLRARGLVRQIEIPEGDGEPARVVELVYPPEVAAEICRPRERLHEARPHPADPPAPENPPASGRRPRKEPTAERPPGSSPGAGGGTVLAWMDPRKTRTGG